MKILAAILSTDIKDTARTLSWAARAGYNLRVFVPDESELNAYHALVDDLNYNEFLDLNYAVIVSGVFPVQYGKAQGYDLLLQLPEGLRAWNKTKNKNLMVIEFAADVGRARAAMFKSKPGEVTEFENGAKLRKL